MTRGTYIRTVEQNKKNSNDTKKYHREHPECQTGKKNSNFGKNHSGKNSPAWIEDRSHIQLSGIYPASYRDIDEEVRELLGENCAECGKTPKENRRRMVKHHIDEDVMNNSVDNFRLLCMSCHINLHRQQ